jgi:thioredoxin-like negative regulator of GroEL
MSKVVEITTEEDFVKFVNENKRAVIFYGAVNCHACENIKPLFNSIANKYYKRIAFGYTDVEKAKLNIKFVPLLVSFRSGEEIMRKLGADNEALRDFIKESINNK